MKKRLVAFCKRFIKSVYSRAFVLFHEKVYGYKGKYMFVNKHSNVLIIVFSAFGGEVPRYNYFYSFRKLNISQLYILDNYGYRGSYYLFENGDNIPEQNTTNIISSCLMKYNIRTVITAGTSKGGTAAIYYGLKIKADHIFSGACQYYIGTYVGRKEFQSILEGMKGNLECESFLSYLDNVMKDVIIGHKEDHGKIHLLYSKNELTYERQIVHLIHELNTNGYSYDEKIEAFADHDEVGKFFIPWMIEWIKEQKYL